MCLIQSLERDAHGMSDGSLLKVQGSEHTGLTVHFNGTDQGISTGKMHLGSNIPDLTVPWTRNEI